MRTSLVPVAALALALAACNRGSDAHAAASSAAAKASAAPKKGAPPCEVRMTGKYAAWMDKPGLEYTLVNRGDRPLKFCYVHVYAYDAAGKQVGHATMNASYPIEPGASETPGLGIVVDDDTGASLVKRPGITFEGVASHVIFVDGTEWEDDDLVPDQRPKGGKK